MNKHINRDMVYWMLRTGWHPERIAERLECSRRQVDRISKKNGWGGSATFTSFTNEHSLWELYREGMNEPYAKIGLRFGRSRQAVQQYFEQNKNEENIMSDREDNRSSYPETDQDVLEHLTEEDLPASLQAECNNDKSSLIMPDLKETSLPKGSYMRSVWHQILHPGVDYYNFLRNERQPDDE